MHEIRRCWQNSLRRYAAALSPRQGSNTQIESLKKTAVQNREPLGSAAFGAWGTQRATCFTESRLYKAKISHVLRKGSQEAEPNSYHLFGDVGWCEQTAKGFDALVLTNMRIWVTVPNLSKSLWDKRELQSHVSLARSL